MDIGPSELIIILVIVLLLFGGSRLAGLGKSAGRALKEFKEETQQLSGTPTAAPGPAPTALSQPEQGPTTTAVAEAPPAAGATALPPASGPEAASPEEPR